MQAADILPEQKSKPAISIYFILNGLINGEEGVFGIDCSGTKQHDGWYYLIEREDGSMPMSDGEGPWKSHEEAKREAEKATAIPPFEVEDLIGTLFRGHFRQFTATDWGMYSGAGPNAVIRNMVGYDVVVCTYTDRLTELNIHVYSPDGRCWRFHEESKEWIAV